ncbi:hypothetical protein [Acidovorax radicis]|jgi:hypothetical protein|uniref:hypothetical protein n=1 Tax=Acidovorax radicis TaxID=758826 RepID=UPI001CF87D22|nr:hypothetical protein [Acidovorax radicis]UCU97517.1 hypothetical protein KI609_12995 [Acidovorax radicis]
MGAQKDDIAVKAVAAGAFEFGLGQAAERQTDFLQLLKQAEGHLLHQKVSVNWPSIDSSPSAISFTSPLGEIQAKFFNVLGDGGYITAGLVFFDEKPLSTSLDKRPLYSVKLMSNGEWIGSDGESMAVDHGRLTPASAFKAVRSALARKLRLDTEFVDAIGGGS